MPDSLLQIEKMKKIADILMGAAFADGRYEQAEGETVQRVLADMSEDKELPTEVRQQIEAFDPESFDLESTCSMIFLTDSDERRTLLKLVAAVTEADEVHDLDESDYIVQVARAIRAEEDEYEGLTIEILSVTDAASPPPVPGS